MRKSLLVMACALGLATAASAHETATFRARLTGGDLSGNPIVTNAKGEARLAIIDNNTAVRFEVEVQGLSNLWQAHIHIAPKGPVAQNQPVGPIAFFFVPTIPGAPNSNVPGPTQDEISAGFVMTNAQLVGPLTFDPNNPTTTGIAGLIKAIQEGRASIVVHTSDLNDANNRIPGVAGDSPAGEIRGLIQ